MPFTGAKCQRTSATLICVAILSLAGACGISPTDNQEDLLPALVAHNAAERAKITSYVVELELESKVHTLPLGLTPAPDPTPGASPPGIKVFVSAKLYRKGQWLAVEKHTRTEGMERGGMNRTWIAVLNDEYSAFSMRPGHIEQHFHASIAEMSTREQDLSSVILDLDPLKLSYDCVAITLGGVIENANQFKDEGHRLEVHEQNVAGGAAYLLQHFMPSMFGGEKPDTEYLIEPGRGFIVTRIRAYDNDGSVRIRRDVEAQQLKAGIWFPRIIVDNWRGAQDTTITIKSAEVNGAVPDETFQLAGVGLEKEGAQLGRTTVDGKLRSYVYNQGEWIPKELLPSSAAEP